MASITAKRNLEIMGLYIRFFFSLEKNLSSPFKTHLIYFIKDLLSHILGYFLTEKKKLKEAISHPSKKLLILHEMK